MKEFKVRCVFKNPFWKVGLQGLKECEFCCFRSFHAVSYFQEKYHICLLCDSASHNKCNFIDLNKKVLANKKIPNDLSSYTCGL